MAKKLASELNGLSLLKWVEQHKKDLL
jgi:hypothetical protein